MRMVWSACVGVIALGVGVMGMTFGVGSAFAADDPLSPAVAPAAAPSPTTTPKADPDDKADPAPLSGPKADPPADAAPAGPRGGGFGEGGRAGPGRGAGGGGAGGGGVTDAQILPGSIRQAMTWMQRALKKLKTQAGDAAKKDENLKLVADMQRACLGAKQLTPGRRGETPDPDKIAIYRRELIATMQQLLTLESQLMDGKTEDAAKTVESIADRRDEAHGMLGVDG